MTDATHDASWVSQMYEATKRLRDALLKSAAKSDDPEQKARDLADAEDLTKLLAKYKLDS